MEDPVEFVSEVKETSDDKAGDLSHLEKAKNAMAKEALEQQEAPHVKLCEFCLDPQTLRKMASVAEASATSYTPERDLSSIAKEHHDQITIQDSTSYPVLRLRSPPKNPGSDMLVDQMGSLFSIIGGSTGMDMFPISDNEDLKDDADEKEKDERLWEDGEKDEKTLDNKIESEEKVESDDADEMRKLFDRQADTEDDEKAEKNDEEKENDNERKINSCPSFSHLNFSSQFSLSSFPSCFSKDLVIKEETTTEVKDDAKESRVEKSSENLLQDSEEEFSNLLTASEADVVKLLEVDEVVQLLDSFDYSSTSMVDSSTTSVVNSAMSVVNSAMSVMKSKISVVKSKISVVNSAVSAINPEPVLKTKSEEFTLTDNLLLEDNLLLGERPEDVKNELSELSLGEQEEFTKDESGEPSGDLTGEVAEPLFYKKEQLLGEPSSYVTTSGKIGKPSSNVMNSRELGKPSSDVMTAGEFGEPSSDVMTAGELGKPSSDVMTAGELGEPSVAQMEDEFGDSSPAAVKDLHGDDLVGDVTDEFGDRAFDPKISKVALIPVGSSELSIQSVMSSVMSLDYVTDADESDDDDAREQELAARKFVLLRRMPNTFPFSKDCLNIMDVTHKQDQDGNVENLQPIVRVTIAGIMSYRNEETMDKEGDAVEETEGPEMSLEMEDNCCCRKKPLPVVIPTPCCSSDSDYTEDESTDEESGFGMGEGSVSSLDVLTKRLCGANEIE